MANPEHLEILKQGVEVWNDWRDQHPAIGPDLSGYNLCRGNLAHVNFSSTPSQLFAALQSDASNCNQYAAFLSQITDAYSFPYTDKTAAPFLNLTPGAADAMTITILSD